MKETAVIESTQRWLEKFVIQLNLCPFAKRVTVKNRMRIAVTYALTEQQLLRALAFELDLLNESSVLETSLLIHPNVLNDFMDYNQFLDLVDGLLQEMKLEGVFQIATFHPHYQFNGTSFNDAENYTNRAPYPMLHLLSEDSVEKAVKTYSNVEQIPVQNIALMDNLGAAKLKQILADCLVATNEK